MATIKTAQKVLVNMYSLIETREGHRSVRTYQRIASQSIILADDVSEAKILDEFTRWGKYVDLLDGHGTVVFTGNPVHTVDTKQATNPAETLTVIEDVLKEAKINQG